MKKFLIITGIFLIISILAACSALRDSSVSTEGSTSMEKVIGSLGEAFMIKNPDFTFTYNPTGSGAGIAAVYEGRCDIGLSSRMLKEEEKARGLFQSVLAYDAMAIIVNNENPVSDLSIETIREIYTGIITNWNEAGGANTEIILIGREAGSGTREGFEGATGTEHKCKYRQELTSSGDVITTVSQTPGAIGYASLAAVKNNVKKVSVNGVIPMDETVKNGTYLIKRPFVAVTKTDTPLSLAAEQFLEYAQSDEATDIISGAGAVSVR